MILRIDRVPIDLRREFSKDIPEGFPWPDLDEEPQLGSPGVDPDAIKFFAKKLGDDARDELLARQRREPSPATATATPPPQPRPAKKPSAGGKRR